MPPPSSRGVWWGFALALALAGLIATTLVWVGADDRPTPGSGDPPAPSRTGSWAESTERTDGLARGEGSVGVDDWLVLPERSAAAPIAVPLPGDRLDPVAVRGALGRLGKARRLGGRVGIVVSGLDGVPVLRAGPDQMTPASSLKLLTTSAAMAALGPDAVFTTRTVRAGDRLTLLGGGDPYLSTRQEESATLPKAGLDVLAARTARQLTRQGLTRVRLSYDATLFTGPSNNPAWPTSYVRDGVVSPISALWVEQGRTSTTDARRVRDPARAAAQRFAELLRTRGITVVRGIGARSAAPQAVQVAAVDSAPLSQIASRVLEVSDNEGAEVLLRHVALARDEDPSFVGGTAAVRAALAELGVSLRGARLLDGSGLSRENRVRPVDLVAAMAMALAEPRPGLAALVTGLPVAGFTGSLTDRFEVGASPGLGWLRAKTGTLTGVHGLAGVVRGRDGAAMLFALMTDDVALTHTLFARDRLDQMGAALAGCRCAAP